LRAVNFPDWLLELEQDPALQVSDRKSYLITIRWYLVSQRRAHPAVCLPDGKDLSALAEPFFEVLEDQQDLVLSPLDTL